MIIYVMSSSLFLKLYPRLARHWESSMSKVCCQFFLGLALVPVDNKAACANRLGKKDSPVKRTR